MPSLETLVRMLRMVFFVAMVAWVVAAGAIEYMNQAASESTATYPVAPINE